MSQSPWGGVTGSPFWFTSSSKSIMYEERVCPSGWKALMHDKMEGGREGEVHSSGSPPQALNHHHLLHRTGCFSFKDSYKSSFEGHNMRRPLTLQATTTTSHTRTALLTGDSPSTEPLPGWHSHGTLSVCVSVRRSAGKWPLVFQTHLGEGPASQARGSQWSERCEAGGEWKLPPHSATPQYLRIDTPEGEVVTLSQLTLTGCTVLG